MIAPKQGDIYLVTLDPTIGTEMAKTRPGVIVSNDHANKGSNRVSVVPITSSNIDKVYPFEVFLPAKSETGLNYDSKIACDQVRSVDKRRLLKNSVQCLWIRWMESKQHYEYILRCKRRRCWVLFLNPTLVSLR